MYFSSTKNQKKSREGVLSSKRFILNSILRQTNRQPNYSVQSKKNQIYIKEFDKASQLQSIYNSSTSKLFNKKLYNPIKEYYDSPQINSFLIRSPKYSSSINSRSFTDILAKSTTNFQQYLQKFDFIPSSRNFNNQIIQSQKFLDTIPQFEVKRYQIENVKYIGLKQYKSNISSSQQKRAILNSTKINENKPSFYLSSSIIMKKIPILKIKKEKLRQKIAEETNEKLIKNLKKKPPIPKFQQVGMFTTKYNKGFTQEINGWNIESEISSDNETQFQ